MKQTIEQAASKLQKLGFKLVSGYDGCKSNVLVKCPYCQQQFEVSYKHLTERHTKSCGCLGNRGDLTGQQFGRWTVMSPTRNSRNQKMWLCRCKCGTEKPVMTHSLIAKVSNSCGCLRNEENAIRFRGGYKHLTGSHWCQIRASATARSMEFPLDIAETYSLIEKQGFKCAISGVEIYLGKTRTASLDRIDSQKGYSIDNIQWIHKTINRMKMDLDESEFIDWCHLISEHSNDIFAERYQNL